MEKEKSESLPGKIWKGLEEKPKPPKKMGHKLADRRPHFKSFKSPGVK